MLVALSTIHLRTSSQWQPATRSYSLPGCCSDTSIHSLMHISCSICCRAAATSHIWIPTSVINQAGLDALLHHGQCIQHLCVSSFVLSASRVDVQCSWQSLTLRQGVSILQFAHLPIKDIKVISAGAPGYHSELHECDPEHGAGLEPQHLEVPLGTRELSGLVLQAVMEGGACQHHHHHWGHLPASTPPERPGTSEWPHLTKLIVDPQDATEEEELGMRLSASTVRAWALGLGNAATSVDLIKCQLTRDFWAAFTECFPAVDHLDVSSSCGYTKFQLLLWCHAMRRPLQVICAQEAGGCECNDAYNMDEALEDFGCPGVVFDYR